MCKYCLTFLMKNAVWYVEKKLCPWGVGHSLEEGHDVFEELLVDSGFVYKTSDSRLSCSGGSDWCDCSPMH